MTFKVIKQNACTYILRIESSGMYPSVSYFYLSEKMRADLIKKLQKPVGDKKDE